MNLVTYGIAFAAMVFPYTVPNNILEKLSWVEEADESGPINMDIFFDRAVFVALGDYQPVTPGVFITTNIILTSFNPFREAKEMPQIIILTGRILTGSKKNLHQKQITHATCARQVVPLPDQLILREQWHGTNRTHSPLHDLFLMRIDDVFKFLDPDPSKYSFSLYTVGSPTYTPAGPMTIAVASPNDTFERDLKFASLGFLNSRHMMKSTSLRSRSYEGEDSVLEDCYEWFPKLWGYFICISNVDKYKGVGSGALLVYDNVLFGIGSFLLRKGNKSILVFTDVRPYYHIIFSTCVDAVRTTTTPATSTTPGK